MLESYNTHTYKAQSQPNKTDFYQQGVGKCQHLPKWFGESQKWKCLQAFFELLPPHCGKC
jgi:hypothetical protein